MVSLLCLVIFYVVVTISQCFIGDVQITITGSTGVLGKALTGSLIQRWTKEKPFPSNHGGSRLVMSLFHRDEQKLRNMLSELLESLRESPLQLTHTECDFRKIDLRRRNIFSRFYSKVFYPAQIEEVAKRSVDHHVLVNCAGIRLLGPTQIAMKQSIRCNTLLPILLAKHFINQYRMYIKNCSGFQRPPRSLRIINIGSGDGESVFIHSDIIRRLNNDIQHLNDLLKFMSELINSFDPKFEYAFGESPMYSLSKCLLHKATQLIHKELELDMTAENAKIFTCCPGNIMSPMTSEEEKSDLISPSTAADWIIEGMELFNVNPVNKYESAIVGGKFYRFGKEIPF